MIKIVLKGNPLSTQNLYRVDCRGNFPHSYMTKKGHEMKESYGWQVKEQYHGEPLEGDLIMNIILYFGDNRRRDIDNFHKLGIDALKGIVFTDDSQIQTLSTTKLYDKISPRTEIIIS